MHDVGPDVFQCAPEWADLQQAEQRLPVNGQCDVLAAFPNQLFDQASAIRNHNRAVAGRDECAGDLQRAALNAPRVQGWQRLYHRQRFFHFFFSS